MFIGGLICTVTRLDEIMIFMSWIDYANFYEDDFQRPFLRCGANQTMRKFLLTHIISSVIYVTSWLNLGIGYVFMSGEYFNVKKQSYKWIWMSIKIRWLWEEIWSSLWNKYNLKHCLTSTGNPIVENPHNGISYIGTTTSLFRIIAN